MVAGPGRPPLLPAVRAAVPDSARGSAGAGHRLGERGNESGEIQQLSQLSLLHPSCAPAIVAACVHRLLLSSKMMIEMPLLVVSAAFAVMCR